MSHEFGTKLHDNFTQRDNTVVVHATQRGTMNFGPAFEVRDWRDDFLQIGVGPGRVAFTQKVSASEQHACPNCGSATSAKLVDIPEDEAWGRDYACECGAEYSGESIGERREFSPEKLTDGRENFAYWSGTRSVPADARILYGWLNADHQREMPHFPSIIVGIELADGERVVREAYLIADTLAQ